MNVLYECPLKAEMERGEGGYTYNFRSVTRGRQWCLRYCLSPPLEFDSDSRAGDVRFRSIPTPTPAGRSYVGGMVVKEVSKDCVFNEDFGNVFKSAVGAVVYKLR